MDYLNLVQPWAMGPPHTLAKTRIFDLNERRCASPTTPDKVGTFVYLDSPDWINVIALTRGSRVVMIEQFRHGSGEVTLEIPGGMVDPDESPADACLRELREETGYAGKKLDIIGTVSPNPAILNNRCYTGLVRNVTHAGAVELDTNEEIAVRLVPLGDIPDLIRQGVIHHALVICAFHHLLLRD